jgi:hypothetical protein
MLQSGSHLHHQHHHHPQHHPHQDQNDEESWRQLLHIVMLTRNMRSHIADCKEGSRTPVQPQLDYDSFDPDDPHSVDDQAPAVIKCLNDSQNGTEG